MHSIRRYAAPLLITALVVLGSHQLTLRQFEATCGDAGIRSLRVGLLGLGSRVDCNPPAPASRPASTGSD